MSPLLAGLPALLLVVADAAVVRFFVRDRAYCRRLMAKITGTAGEP